MRVVPVSLESTLDSFKLSKVPQRARVEPQNGVTIDHGRRPLPAYNHPAQEYGPGLEASTLPLNHQTYNARVRTRGFKLTPCALRFFHPLCSDV